MVTVGQPGSCLNHTPSKRSICTQHAMPRNGLPFFFFAPKSSSKWSMCNSSSLCIIKKISSPSICFHRHLISCRSISVHQLPESEETQISGEPIVRCTMKYLIPPTHHGLPDFGFRTPYHGIANRLLFSASRDQDSQSPRIATRSRMSNLSQIYHPILVKDPGPERLLCVPRPRQ